MKRHTNLLLASTLVMALAGVSAAQADDRRDGDRDREYREERWDDRSWDRDRSDRRGEHWDQRGNRHGRSEDRWDRAQRSWERRGRRADERWDRREARHDFRIRRGIRHGEITRGEAFRLRMMQRRLEMMQRRAWADGHLSLRERMAIRRLLQREGRTIGRYNHNGWSNRSY